MKNLNIAIPPIVENYINNAFDPNLPAHVRNNYRDQLDMIREICGEAVVKFDKKYLNFKNTTNKQKPIK